MKTKALLASTLILIVIASSAISAQTTEITYQGQLQSSSSPANGNFDFEFVLYDGGGSQIGAILPRNGVSVVNGVFSVNLDFGSGFPGATRFLEIRVRTAGGGAFTTLSPRQPVTSSPYSIKSLTADIAASAATAVNATNAANAQNAVTFSGTLNGDVTGTQSATTVARLRGRDVSATQPSNGQVLKFNTSTGQWEPAADETATAGGGGTITGVAAGTGLTGGGSTGNVTVGIANGGVGTNQLADNSVTDAKIVSVSGSKVTGTVPNATNAINATTATNATQLGGVPASQYLQSNGNGSGLTNLNASSITTGTLANARLGQIPTANIADGAVTAPKIASDQVVKTLNGLTDSVTLAGTGNITVTPSGNTLTISTTSGGVGGSGNTGTIPVWNNPTTLGSSLITQTSGAVQLPNTVQLAPGGQGSNITLGMPNNETGVTIGGANVRSDIRFDGTVLRILTGPAGSPPSANSGISIGGGGRVGIGGIPGVSKFGVYADASSPIAMDVQGISTGVSSSGRFRGVSGFSSTGEGVSGTAASGTGVAGNSGSGIGVQGTSAGGDGVRGESTNGHGVNGLSAGYIGVRGVSSSGIGVNAACGASGCTAISASATSWFRGDTTPLSVANTGAGTGIAIGSGGANGYIQAYDYDVNQARTLLLNNSGGPVEIGTSIPTQASVVLDVNGRGRIRNIPQLPTFGFVCFTQAGDLYQCGGSSLRWKTNIQPFRSGLDVLTRLQPISYNWKEDGRYDIGLGAEDVAKVAPSLASTNANGEVQGVRYERLNMLMINAIKEQQRLIEEQRRLSGSQQAGLETLKRANERLASRLSTVERKLKQKSGARRRR